MRRCIALVLCLAGCRQVLGIEDLAAGGDGDGGGVGGDGGGGADSAAGDGAPGTDALPCWECATSNVDVCGLIDPGSSWVRQGATPVVVNTTNMTFSVTPPAFTLVDQPGIAPQLLVVLTHDF